MTRRRSKPRPPSWVTIAAGIMIPALIIVAIGFITGWNDCGSSRLAIGDAAYAARCAGVPNWDGGVLVAIPVVTGILWFGMKGWWS